MQAEHSVVCISWRSRSNAFCSQAQAASCVQVGKAQIPQATFDNIYQAVLAVFRVITTENWNNISDSGMAATSDFACLFFVVSPLMSLHPSIFDSI